MTAKEFLEQYHDVDIEISETLETLMRLRSRAEKCTTAFGDGTGGSQPNPDKIPAIVEKIMEEEERVQERVSELMKIQDDVQSAISKVKDATCRNILMMRYIGNKSFESISVIMNYDYWYLTHKLHPKALQMIEEIALKST